MVQNRVARYSTSHACNLCLLGRMDGKRQTLWNWRVMEKNKTLFIASTLGRGEPGLNIFCERNRPSV